MIHDQHPASQESVVTHEQTKHPSLIQNHRLSVTKNQWVDHGNFKATKMDQSTLPADSKHVRMKTMTADWHQEYPTPAPVQHFFNPIKGAAAVSGSSLLF